MNEHYQRVSILWTVILGRMVTPDDVARMMAGLELIHLATKPGEYQHLQALADHAQGLRQLQCERAAASFPAVPKE